MPLKNLDSSENSPRFNNLYAVEFDKKRIMRPESMKFVFGRSKSSDLVISSPKVNDKHCEISCCRDTWILHNLSPEGTSMVGKAVARDATLQLEPETILKIGGIYLQLISEIEIKKEKEPAVRILKISVLVGEKCCYLTDDKQPENQPVARSGGQAIGARGAVQLSATAMAITNGERPKEKLGGEINDIIDNMATANLQLTEELKEKEEALRRTLIEMKDMEMITRELQQQLISYQGKEAAESMLVEVMENELQCTICSEPMIDAVTLDCSHSYCNHCLSQWKTSHTICPICRKSIAYQCPTRVINSLIEIIIKNLPSEVQKRRKEVIESRKGRNN